MNMLQHLSMWQLDGAQPHSGRRALREMPGWQRAMGRAASGMRRLAGTAGNAGLSEGQGQGGQRYAAAQFHVNDVLMSKQ